MSRLEAELLSAKLIPFWRFVPPPGCLPCGQLENCYFWTGDFTGWALTSEATLSIVTDPVKCGSYSLRDHDTTLKGNHYVSQSVPATSDMFFRLCFYVDSVSISTAKKLIIGMIYRGILVGVPFLSLSIGVDGGVYKLYGNYVSGSSYFPSNSVFLANLTLDTWIKALLVLNVGNTGYAKIYLDADLKLDVSGIDTNNFGSPDSVLIGDMGAMPQGTVNGTVDIYFDETYEDDVTG